MNYFPDKWVALKITSEKEEIVYKIFGTWRGGYLSGDSWRLNSGVEKVKLSKNTVSFIGGSGSEYICHKDSYGCSVYTDGVLRQIADTVGEAGGELKLIIEKDAISKNFWARALSKDI